jgi:hypothetical protein
MSLSWDGMFAYAFPPFRFLLQVLLKIKQSDCRLVAKRSTWGRSHRRTTESNTTCRSSHSVLTGLCQSESQTGNLCISSSRPSVLHSRRHVSLEGRNVGLRLSSVPLSSSSASQDQAIRLQDHSLLLVDVVLLNLYVFCVVVCRSLFVISGRRVAQSLCFLCSGL